MFGRQRGAETRVAGLAQLPYRTLVERLGDLAVRAPALQSMQDPAISLGSQPSL
jgi:hypothetical protein